MTATTGSRMIKAFGPIRIINLAERQDRRDEMARELARIGLAAGDYSFFTAQRPADKGDFPTVGARGCFESHLAVLRQIAEGPDDCGLLLEDDCDFSSHLVQGLAAAEAGDWDIFFGFYSGTDPRSRPQGPNLVSLWPDEPIICAHFMAIRRDTARAMVSHLQGIQSRPAGHPDGGAMHVDGAYNWFRRMNPGVRVLATRPAIAVQRPSQSNIHPTADWKRRGPIGAFLTLARRAKRWLGLHLR